eukprot:SAG25_NODE_704_length_5847_cov_3.595338_3_plen_108_part_00
MHHTHTIWFTGAHVRRLVCDENVLLGGCSEEFAEEEGVLCSDCNLFLCFGCFGKLVVNNECQVPRAAAPRLPLQDLALSGCIVTRPARAHRSEGALMQRWPGVEARR